MPHSQNKFASPKKKSSLVSERQTEIANNNSAGGTEKTKRKKKETIVGRELGDISRYMPKPSLTLPS